MEVYNPKDGRNWHEIKYTLQSGEYKGWFTTEVATMCSIDIVSSNCEFEVDEDNESFSCILHDDNGNDLFFDCCYEEDVREMLVAIEIINVR